MQKEDNCVPIIDWVPPLRSRADLKAAHYPCRHVPGICMNEQSISLFRIYFNISIVIFQYKKAENNIYKCTQSHKLWAERSLKTMKRISLLYVNGICVFFFNTTIVIAFFAHCKSGHVSLSVDNRGHDCIWKIKTITSILIELFCLYKNKCP